MSSWTTMETHWTCDRCGATETQSIGAKATDVRPMGWAYVQGVRKPNGVDLCEKCVALVLARPMAILPPDLVDQLDEVIADYDRRVMERYGVMREDATPSDRLVVSALRWLRQLQRAEER